MPDDLDQNGLHLVTTSHQARTAMVGQGPTRPSATRRATPPRDWLAYWTSTFGRDEAHRRLQAIIEEGPTGKGILLDAWPDSGAVV